MPWIAITIREQGISTPELSSTSCFRQGFAGGYIVHAESYSSKHIQVYDGSHAPVSAVKKLVRGHFCVRADYMM
jgi:hypothetical protein